ncbi:MAG TPA: ribosome recycling factor [Candidatus Desulfofervidus auxilii]|uniref:Ribosome-recycling factor n=1 Tax=Desulfofervidus auxilii TaxID=1621989 RepID=A0A7C0YB16_DESA2|nr:ribosome recycling factor [Candidatus Desulfofervidus auxilii]
MLDEVYKDARTRMKKTLQVLEHDLGKIRTGRASVSLVEEIKVDYYGTPTPLNQLASISVPESRLITIQPWDPSSLGAIEKAILKSDLGLTPTNDGKIIRISIPPLTEERRKELVKVVHKIGEEAKVAIRQIRRDANETLKKMKKNKEISEDEFHRGQEEVQKITDEFIKKVEEALKKKEDEILKF